MCAGMEVLNRAIESIMNSTDRDEWEPTVIHVTDNVLSLWRGQVTQRCPAWFILSSTSLSASPFCFGQEGEEPLWECQVRFLTFLGVGHDSHTFAVIVDGGTQQFECHVFWCEPDAGNLSEAVQAACMVSSAPRLDPIQTKTTMMTRLVVSSSSGPVSEVSGGPDPSSQDQVLAYELVQGQTGQLPGRRHLPASHIPSPRHSQRHRGDTEGLQGQRRQQQREEGHDGLF